jgi:flagellar basal body rod protein FlgG
VIYGMYLSTGGMLTQRHRLDVIANNMANVNTTSFKRDVAYFTTRPVESSATPGGFAYRHGGFDAIGGGTFVSPTYTEFAAGEVELTQRSLDVYIKGPGFLQVRKGDEVCFTRDGRLTISRQGFLATLEGELPVLNGAGQMIRLDESKAVEIKVDGLINQDGEVVGEIELVSFEQPGGLRKIGDSLYRNPGQVTPEAIPAQLVTGALERSTVDPVQELVAMIETQRAYEANAQMIRIQDQTLGRAISGLTQNI